MYNMLFNSSQIGHKRMITVAKQPKNTIKNTEKCVAISKTLLVKLIIKTPPFCFWNPYPDS
ncbi:hypothetical protein EMIT074MI3_11341 [Bacillus licheniformis]